MKLMPMNEIGWDGSSMVKSQEEEKRVSFVIPNVEFSRALHKTRHSCIIYYLTRECVIASSLAWVLTCACCADEIEYLAIHSQFMKT